MNASSLVDDSPRVRLLPLKGSEKVRVKLDGFLGPDRFASYRDASSGCRLEREKSPTGRVFKRTTCAVDRLPGVIKRLRAAGFDVWAHPEVQARLDAQESAAWADLQSARERLSAIDDELRSRGEALFPYQRIGIEWLAQRTGALLADEQGLGKTATALCSLPSGARVLVICPAGVKGVWSTTERSKFRPGFKASTLEGRGSFRWPEQGEIVVTNYDILPRVHEPECPRVFEKKCAGCVPGERNVHRPDCDRSKTFCEGCSPIPEPPEGVTVVVDEAHMAKNPKSQRGESVRRIGRAAREKAGRAWLLTGTPMKNEPGELWSVLELADLAYEAFSSRKDFLDAFGAEPNVVERKVNGVFRREVFGWKWGGAKKEVAERLQRVMLRRMKDDVASDLPERMYRYIDVTIDDAALSACEKALAELGGVEALRGTLLLDKIPFELIAKVRSALAKAKTPAMLAMADVAEQANEKLIVFSAHVPPVEAVAARKGWVKVTGDMTAKQKTASVREFQEGEAIGIAGTIGAMGTGVTLTAGSHMVFVDQAWTPADNVQARDRAHRHGQKSSVLYELLVANHPLDKRLTEVLAGKETLVKGSVDAAREQA